MNGGTVDAQVSGGRGVTMDHRAFFREVAGRVGCDLDRAEALTLAVFEELRDRLTEREAEKAGAQMDSHLRSMWHSLEHSGRQVRKLHAPEFLGEVRKMTGLADDLEAERAVCSVFAALQLLFGSIGGGEGAAGHIMSQLPKDLQTLWCDADRRSRRGEKASYGITEEIGHGAGRSGKDR